MFQKLKKGSLLKPLTKTSYIYRALSKLKNGKSTGIDNIPNQALKVIKDVVTNSLTDIFNACIKHKVFPHDLKVGRVTPIFKEGEKEDLNNYLPITVLPGQIKTRAAHFWNFL